MELRQIKLFLAVAEEGHFGRAASRMFISQPALSQHVRRLERELGVQLFDRSARQVNLTPAGNAFLEVARRMNRQLAEAALAARRAEAGEVGRLALGVHVPVAAPVLSVLLRQWSHVRPAVSPQLTSGRGGDLVDLVRRGDLDLALVDGPVADRAVVSTPVLEDRMVVLLPSDHVLARRSVVSVPDLAGEHFVVVSRSCSPTLHDHCLELCDAGARSPEIALEVEDSDLVPLAVAAGLGVGLAARLSMAARAIPGVVCRPLSDPKAIIPLVATSLRNGATPQTREFLRMIEALRRSGQLSLPPMAPADVEADVDVDLTAPSAKRARLLQPAV